MKPGSTEQLHINIEGLSLAAEMRLPDGPGPYPALCICHGIPAGSTPDPADGGYPALADWFRGHGFAVLIFNFRGAGDSDGNLDMPGWTRDVGATVDYLHSLDEIDQSRISVMGFSGGAAASAYRAARETRISSLVLCACPARFFDNSDIERYRGLLDQCREVGTIRDRDFPPSIEEWVQGFQEVNPIRWIHDIAPRPVFIIHGDKDETVDPSQAYELYDKAGEPREIFMIPGAEHRLRTNQPAMDAALAWLKKVNGLPEN